MDRGRFTFNLIVATTFVPVVLLALVYSLPIIFIRRYQRRNTIFTLNVCLAAVLYCVTSLVNYLLLSVENSFTVQMPTFRCLYALRA